MISRHLIAVSIRNLAWARSKLSTAIISPSPSTRQEQNGSWHNSLRRHDTGGQSLMNGVSGWTLALEVPKAAADIFDRALAPISVATSAFEIEGSELWRIEAFAVERPDENAVVGAVALAAELAGIDEPEVHVLPLPAIDWVAKSEILRAYRGRSVLHSPDTLRWPDPWAVTRLAVDAGPAFGTGSHGSTMGCLLAIDHLSHHPRADDSRSRLRYR